ncbi:MAG: hypothetical protein JOZ77_09050 [Candidatus Eremiobacteraeota bacterium]|nr:hypothetical protein [Candidatus Eremiobacteraeota bacterium]
MNAPRWFLLSVSAALLAACGNSGASEPPVTSYDPAATSKLQFAVGVATMSFNGGKSVAYGLNTVDTLRQQDGLSGVLYSIPMIIGPTSFNVLTSTETGTDVQDAGSDLGTNHITWGTLNQSHWTTAPRGPKASTTGAFGYGLCPCNSDSGPGNGFTPLFQSFYLPIYGETGYIQLWYGGPPAFPQAGPPEIALGWEGYSLGFADFAVTPVVGTYHLYAAVPPSYDTPPNPTPSPGPNGTPTPPPGILASASQLTNLTPLPQLGTPTFTPDHNGGGKVNITAPSGVSEVLVEVLAVGNSGVGICVQSHQTDSFYTIVTKKPGAQSVVLPDDIGPLTQSGKKTPTICPKGTYEIYAAGVDYPAYEASYPNNLNQLPLIKGPNGQADVTTSDVLTGSYR